MSIIYTQVENADGKWVILTKEAMQQFGCPDGMERAYVLAYNAREKQELLKDEKSSTTVSEDLDPFSHVKKKLIDQGALGIEAV